MHKVIYTPAILYLSSRSRDMQAKKEKKKRICHTWAKKTKMPVRQGDVGKEEKVIFCLLFTTLRHTTLHSNCLGLFYKLDQATTTELKNSGQVGIL